MTLATARFEALAGGASAPVDFNPASLKITVANKLQEPEDAGGGAARQQTRTTTTKLAVELIFDSTETGRDVREKTGRLKTLAVVADEAPTAPPRIAFVWGRFRFEGVIESLDETLDFWSQEGVPLRAGIQLTLQGVGADTVQSGAASQATLGAAPEGGFGATEVATAAGDPGAGRGLAAANGLENMRLPLGGALSVGGGASAGFGASAGGVAGVELRAAAGFQASAGFGASAGAGFGASAGAGFGASAGAGFGASAGASAGVGFGVGAVAGGGASAGFGASAGAGFGASAGAGFGASAGAGFGASAGAGFGASAGAGFGASAGAGFGASAGAGFGASAGAGFGASAGAGFGASAGAGFGASATAGASASAGAFAGLGAGARPAPAVRLDPSRLLPPPPASGASFDLTGRVTATASSGLSADVSRSVRFGPEGG